MKGYLQRMVAGATRPTRTLHPLVGGLFVKNQQQGVVEESAVVSSLSEAGQIDEGIEAGREVREIQKPDRLVVQPLAGRDLRGKMLPELQDRIREDDIEVSGSIQKSVADERETEHESIEARRVYTLLMPESVDRDPDEVEGAYLAASEHRVDGEVTRVARTATERVATEKAGRQEIERGSEDIQIHIGRIEVIAVPPPVQRAAPAVIRKSESLEEYLGRRDRRAR